MALVLSRSLLKPLAGTEIQAALESAMSKASKPDRKANAAGERPLPVCRNGEAAVAA
jgi:hypothetical protein